MIRTYDTGLDANKINFEAKVGTAEVAYTSVSLRKDGEKPKKILESNANSGNIPKAFIGKAAKLKDHFLVITVKIKFSAFDQSMWEQLKNNTTTSFILEGGFSGTKKYTHAKDEIQVLEGGEFIIIDVAIQLV